jgi:hypothetical protein
MTSRLCSLQTPSGIGEAATQSARWQRIVSDPAYWMPLAQYGVGQGTWSTQALSYPADADVMPGTILTDSDVAQILYQDSLVERQAGPESDRAERSLARPRVGVTSRFTCA